MDFEVFKSTVLNSSNEDIVNITLRDLPQGIRDRLGDLYQVTGSHEIGTLHLTITPEIALRMSDAIDEGNKAIDDALRPQTTNVLSLNWVQRLVFKVFFKKGEDYVF
jgi:hypothetical protein